MPIKRKIPGSRPEKYEYSGQRLGENLAEYLNASCPGNDPALELVNLEQEQRLLFEDRRARISELVQAKVSAWGLGDFPKVRIGEFLLEWSVVWETQTYNVGVVPP